MEESVQNNFVVFLIGLGTMITFHNSILSAKRFFSRNYGTVSDALRIICNVGNLWRFILSLGYFVTPSNVTNASCEALGYLYIIGFNIFHVSLCTFLLWTLYRMSFKKKDLFIGIAFLLIQTALIIPEMIFARPASLPLNLKAKTPNELFPEGNYCELTFTTSKFRFWAMNIMGFLTLFYGVSRFAYLTKNRKRNLVTDAPTVKTSNENNDNSTTTTENVVAVRYPLNLSTIYWSITLLMLTFMLIWLSSSLDDKPDKIMLLDRDNNVFRLFYKNFLFILISYIITYLDGEKRKNVIFYSCGGQNGREASENVRNSVNKLDGEAWVICSRKEKKKDSDEDKVVENNDV